VTIWVAGYKRAWRDGDRDGDGGAIASLFTDDARCLTSPYAQPHVGHEAIRGRWLDDEVFTVEAQPVAVEGDTAVVRLLIRRLTLAQASEDSSAPFLSDSQRSLHSGQTGYFCGSRLGTHTLPQSAITGVPSTIAAISLSLGT
jgi:SnoaL-like domain